METYDFVGPFMKLRGLHNKNKLKNLWLSWRHQNIIQNNINMNKGFHFKSFPF